MKYKELIVIGSPKYNCISILTIEIFIGSNISDSNNALEVNKQGLNHIRSAGVDRRL